MKSIRNVVAIAIVVLFAVTGQAYADCYQDGKAVPEGTRIGSFVCEGGQWVWRP